MLFEGNDQHPLLQRLTDDARVRALIAAPLLVCTVDHLTPATESLRGGRQIAPMLRLMTGDLVLDEPDDFDMADLPALTRLVHWAGLLGSRVLLSSATLPPALVEGLFLAYRAGRAVFQQHRSDRPGEPVNVCCLWIDEFDLTVQDCPDGASFRASHEGYVHKRVKQLAKTEVRRLAQIALLPETWSGMATVERRSDFARFVLERAWHLHQQSQNHSIDPISGKRVSLGLIRMANISPLFDVALAMYAQGVLAPGMRVHLCVYHSQFPLLARSAIERQLDTVLNRRHAADGADPVFQQPAIRRLIDASPEQDQLFIVLGSPVTEVGRDHDYDWAVVEPSSMRSLIQLAGRVRRHRPGAVDGVNLLVLDSNLRAYEHPGRAAYCKPGFEMDKVCDKADTARHFHLHTHQLQTLLAKHTQGASLWPVDARARIAVAKANFHPGKHLVDLEHARMHDAMLPRDVTSAACIGPAESACGSPACCRSSSAFAMTHCRAWMWPFCQTMKKNACSCTAWPTASGVAKSSMCRWSKACCTAVHWRQWPVQASRPGHKWICWRNWPRWRRARGCCYPTVRRGTPRPACPMPSKAGGFTRHWVFLCAGKPSGWMQLHGMHGHHRRL